MALLKAELNRKRKSTNEIIEQSVKESRGKVRYIRQSDLIRREEERQLELQQEQDLKRNKSSNLENTITTDGVEFVESKQNEIMTGLSALTVAEVKNRLRNLGHPVTLFGETEIDRISRLALAQSEEEVDDFRLTAAGHEMKNTFLESQNQERENIDDLEEEKDMNEATSSFTRGDIITHFSTTPGLTPEKIIYKYFRNLLKQWEWDLDDRDDHLKQTANGSKIFILCDFFDR